MSDYWIRTELGVHAGFTVEWHGPYDNQQRAVSVAKELSDPWDATEIVAEVVLGAPGSEGTRLAEFYRGTKYLPGESPWYDCRPPATVDIPLSPKGK
ncbi:hypothetical protein [Thalassoroseus pseudoceratinae]|uniref:hypothetical protein n=1 Tax=Thalassoroseus pseudoceratinae TaxID=2713176 RepID=UPI00141F0799|nr:hypothetical protein [Thalassoroseus pseudoceratinae]